VLITLYDSNLTLYYSLVKKIMTKNTFFKTIVDKYFNGSSIDCAKAFNMSLPCLTYYKQGKRVVKASHILKARKLLKISDSQLLDLLGED
jgi:hypothetical protein